MSAAEIRQQFSVFRDEIDEHNDRRERLIKVSRDVTSLSKKVIFLLHRVDVSCARAAVSIDSTAPSDERKYRANEKVFSDAEAKIAEIVALLRQTAIEESLAAKERAQRYERNVAGGVEEFIEALSFFHYLRTGTLITLPEVQARFCDNSGAALLNVPGHRYLLGLSDLTGELMRLATNAVGLGDVHGHLVTQILTLIRTLHAALDPFVPYIRDMRKKQAVTAQSLHKIEQRTCLHPHALFCILTGLLHQCCMRYQCARPSSAQTPRRCRKWCADRSRLRPPPTTTSSPSQKGEMVYGIVAK